jgi:hypothetical protein
MQSCWRLALLARQVLCLEQNQLAALQESIADGGASGPSGGIGGTGGRGGRAREVLTGRGAATAGRVGPPGHREGGALSAGDDAGLSSGEVGRAGQPRRDPGPAEEAADHGHDRRSGDLQATTHGGHEGTRSPADPSTGWQGLDDLPVSGGELPRVLHRGGPRRVDLVVGTEHLPIGEAERDQELHGTVPSPSDLDEEVYCSLAALLEGEALDILMSTNRGRGLEAWRRLSHRYDGTGPARLRQNLTHILTPERLTLKTMSVGILQWEEKVRVYEHRTKEALSERVRASVLTSMTAGHGPLKEHLELNAGRLKTYAAIREEITLYLDGKNDTAASSLRSNAAPMDVGSVGKQPGSKGGTGKGPADGCWPCGGPHYSRDCPCPDGDKPAAATPATTPDKGKKGKKGKKGAGAQQRGVNAVDQDNQEVAAEADEWGYGDEWTPQEEQVEKELGGLCCVLQEVGLNSLEVAAKDLDGLALEYAATGVVRVTVDSGAAGSVMPPYICPKEETLAPTNVRYRTASGNFLYNQGTRKIRTQHGVFRFGLADVTKPLLSVGEVVAKGHTVVMNADGGYTEIKAPTGERKRVPMKHQDGVFVIELRPRRAPPKQTVQLMPVATEEAASPFHRQIPRL